MPCSDWLGKASIRLLCLVVLLWTGLEGSRHDNCMTEDGRLGVCVSRNYCWQSNPQQLRKCERDDSYCCPFPSKSDHTTRRPPSRGTRPTAGSYTPTSEKPDRRRETPTREKPHRRRGSCGSGVRYPHSSRRSSRDLVGHGRIRRNTENYEIDYYSGNPEARAMPRGGSSGFKVPDGNFRNTENYDIEYGSRSSEPLENPRHGTSGSNVPDGTRRDTEKYERDYDSGDPSTLPETDVRWRWQDDPEEPDCGDREEEESGKRPPAVVPDEDDVISRTPPRLPDVGRPRKVPGCGVKPYTLYIYGGEESSNHEWPWMAALFQRSRSGGYSSFVCGGSLISTRFVLTAAHCFVDRRNRILPASSFVVRLGSNYLDSGEEFAAADRILHPGYRVSGSPNDIALVRLSGQVSVTDRIAPVCLPTPDMARTDLVGEVATVAGWGDGKYGLGRSSPLRHASIPIVSGQECASAYSRVRGAGFLARGSEGVLCAGLREGGKDACQGDSGGPLMLKRNSEQWVVIGIVSLGYKCAEPGYYGVYTRIMHYMSWIEELTRQRH